MIIPKNILKFWGVFFIILAVALGVITLIYRWHRIFPTHEVSEIYSRYAKEEGIDAAFVKDYRVNDSITVDVTVLEAKGSVGWQELRTDFKLPGIQKETSKRMGKNISYKYVPKKDYTKGTDTTNILNNDCVAINYTDSTLCIFHYNDEETRKAISDLLFQHMCIKTSINIK